MDVAMKPAKGTAVDTIYVRQDKVDEMKAKGWVIDGEESAPAAASKSKPKATKSED